MRFFTGLHQPSDAQHFDAAFVSVNRLINRKGPFKVGDWIMDSGAFSHMLRDGEHMPMKQYAAIGSLAVTGLVVCASWLAALGLEEIWRRVR